MIGSRQRSLHRKLHGQELQQSFLPFAVTVVGNQSNADIASSIRLGVLKKSVC